MQETTMAKIKTSSAGRKRPPRQVPEGLRHLRDYYTRSEMLAVVPLCMATIDTLEKEGIFPARITLTPTRRVVWRRREVEKFLEDRARNRSKRAADSIITAH
jgi:predicted DNA-binding transcriptional regulator AlpA